MKKYPKATLLVIMLIICSSCVDNGSEDYQLCDRISEAEILSEEEVGMTCSYFDVFRFKNTLYTICYCCLCDKFAIPMNCEGAALCLTPYRECLDEFYEEAEYLFSISD